MFLLAPRLCGAVPCEEQGKEGIYNRRKKKLHCESCASYRLKIVPRKSLWRRPPMALLFPARATLRKYITAPLSLAFFHRPPQAELSAVALPERPLAQTCTFFFDVRTHNSRL